MAEFARFRAVGGLMRKMRAAALLAVVCLGAPALAGARGVSADTPRADASVRAALDRGDEVLDVLIGVRDGVPYGRALPARPDPKAEALRRGRRLAAQDRIVRDLGPRLQLRRRYDNFPILAARATREAVESLASRADVSWVTLDRPRHAHQSVPQSSQLLIHSDAVNALGVDGSGRAIAILDTGVDYSLAGLGGGGFPNAKVVGGTDFGDDDADPMDCEGHGTSVASVAAGPGGVAPGARLVAL